MTRTQALEHLRVALLQGNKAKATRLYVENRISRGIFNEYWRKFYREPRV